MLDCTVAMIAMKPANGKRERGANKALLPIENIKRRIRFKWRQHNDDAAVRVPPVAAVATQVLHECVLCVCVNTSIQYRQQTQLTPPFAERFAYGRRA